MRFIQYEPVGPAGTGAHSLQTGYELSKEEGPIVRRQAE
jgi:hypothetical protein